MDKQINIPANIPVVNQPRPKIDKEKLFEIKKQKDSAIKLNKIVTKK